MDLDAQRRIGDPLFERALLCFEAFDVTLNRRQFLFDAEQFLRALARS